MAVAKVRDGEEQRGVWGGVLGGVGGAFASIPLPHLQSNTYETDRAKRQLMPWRPRRLALTRLLTPVMAASNQQTLMEDGGSECCAFALRCIELFPFNPERSATNNGVRLLR